MCLNCRSLIKAIDNYIQKADSSLEKQLKAEGYANPKRTVSVITDLEEDIAEALFEETDYILEEAEKAVDLETFAEHIWPEVKLNDGLKGKLLGIFKERLTDFMPEFAGYYLAGLDDGLKITRLSENVMAWVESWSEKLSEIMKLNSHEEIDKILKKGLEEGKGIGAFTKDILESGVRDEYYKARRVAVTEVLTAHRAAQQEAFMQAPAVEEKMWRHTGIFVRAPRQNHVNMDGQRVPKGDPFKLQVADDVYYPLFPGDTDLPPGERINCHCIAQPVVNEDILGLSLEEREQLQQEAIDNMDKNWKADAEARNKAMVGYTEE